MTFADKILTFNGQLSYTGKLPKGISIMNPFQEKQIISITKQFYSKFYNDNKPRHMILGINPGRFGAGVTGVPFTDTKRLTEHCGIKVDEMATHEQSSVFVYKVIMAYGGTEKFYSDFYINSVCPLGFTLKNEKGREVNYNYYDDIKLYNSVYDFICESISKQIKFGISTDVCFCMGNNKNFFYLNELNSKMKFFNKIVPLEHPRFIVQYRLKKIDEYVDKYLKALAEK
jgi:hypothetical protein